MRKRTLPILPALLAAVFTAVFLGARPAHAQSASAADPKDQEIQLLKTEINQLEHRVDTLEGLDQKVKVIDRKLEVQQETVQAEQQKALSMPVVQVGENGFSLSSPNHDYNLNLSGIIQGDGRFFASGADKDVGSTFLLEPGAADSDRLARDVLQLQHHARLRPGQGHAAGRLHKYDLLGLCQPEGREVQGAA